MQHQLFFRMMLGSSLEIIGLQGRVDAKERELAQATERLNDLSLERERIKAATKVARKELERENLLYERALEERDVYKTGVEAKRPIVKKLQEDIHASVSVFKRSEEYEEIQARYFLDGFWYGDRMAHHAYSSWEFDFGTLSIPEKVSDPFSRTLERKGGGSSHGGN